MKPTDLSIQDFLKTHTPRHEPLERLRRLRKATKDGQGKGLQEYVGAFQGTAEPPARPKTLLRMYLPDMRQLQQDVALRPQHYTDRQREIVQHLATGAALDAPVQEHEENELLLAFTRSSEAETKLKDIVARATTTTSDPDSTFENQEFADAIVII